MQYLICGLSCQCETSHVNKHGNTHGVNKLELAFLFRGWALVVIQEDRIPNQKRILQAELSSMHASNPSEEECFCLHILQLNHSEQLNVKCFQLLIDYRNNPLQDRGVVFRVRVYHSFKIRISFCFVHLILDIHYLLENTIDISLCILYVIE